MQIFFKLVCFISFLLLLRFRPCQPLWVILSNKPQGWNEGLLTEVILEHLQQVGWFSVKSAVASLAVSVSTRPHRKTAHPTLDVENTDSPLYRATHVSTQLPDRTLKKGA